MSIRLLPVALAGLLALGTSALAQPLRVPVSAASATALDRYVATPDPAYKWAVVTTRQEGTLTVTTLEMTSQTWRSADEVDRTEWKHYLTVIRPDTVESDTSLLFIAGGANDRAAPSEDRRHAGGHRLRYEDDRHRAADDPQSAADVLQGRRRTQGGRPHRLWLAQVPRRRRRPVAGPLPDDQGGRPCHGHGAGLRAVVRRAAGARSRSSWSPAAPSAAGRRGRRRRSTAASSPSCRP